VFVVWLVTKDGHSFTSALIGYTCSNNRTTVIYALAYYSALYQHSPSGPGLYKDAFATSQVALSCIIYSCYGDLHNKPHRYLAGNVKLIVWKVSS
jgi:hypothetical protein